MSHTGKRKVERPILQNEVPAMLRTLAEQVEQGALSISGKAIAVDEYDTFSVSFRQTKAGMRMRVKVKYTKDADGNAQSGDAADGDE